MLVRQGAPGSMDGGRCQHGQLLGLLPELRRQLGRVQAPRDGQYAQA